MEPTHVLFESGAIVGTVAAFVMFGSLAVGLSIAAWLGREWWRAWVVVAAAARAEKASASGALVAGTATVIGRVETKDEKPAIVLRIDEAGTERTHDEGWSHQWRETERVIEARTFAVRTASGETVNVDPGLTPQVIDDLRVVERPSETTRVREARVAHGATVRVSGLLTGGAARRPRVRIAQAGALGH